MGHWGRLDKLLNDRDQDRLKKKTLAPTIQCVLLYTSALSSISMHTSVFIGREVHHSGRG